jgi:protein-S-isoprenylcysteine O-methyltransferase Ste14
MSLREEFRTQGNILFRFRSYLPLIFFAIIIMAIRNFKYPYASHRLDEIWELFSLLIALFGLGIRAYTIGHVPKGTSGRNSTKQIADVLNTTGIYSIVRHPLYLGNFFMWLGVVLFARSWWLVFVFILVYWLYYERIMYAEEEFLRDKYGVAYIEWANKTPAFLPKFANWQPSNLSFSWRNILKREYHGLFAIIVAFTILEFTGDFIIDGRFKCDWLWVGLFSATLIIYLILRFLTLKTDFLNTEGR